MKVLLATDGSKYSKRAAEKFCQFFKTKEASEIKIISAVESIKPVATEPFGVSTEYYAKLDEEAQKQAEGFIEDTKKIIEKNLSEGTNAEISTNVLMTSPKSAIVDEAKEWGADLIVVGSHGYGFWERMLLGSVSDAVIHHAPCSVLVIRGVEEEEED